MTPYRFLIIFFLLCFVALGAQGQSVSTGGMRGTVRVENGARVAGVTVAAMQGEKELARSITDKNGRFVIDGLQPGTYDLIFRKAGLSSGTLQKVEVPVGKPVDLPDRLILKVDEGSIALLRGAVFDEAGRSVPGARVELFRTTSSGKWKKLDARVSSQIGSFAFRLPSTEARYRITVNYKGAQQTSKDLDVNGAAIYRLAFTLQPQH